MLYKVVKNYWGGGGGGGGGGGDVGGRGNLLVGVTEF